jgi:predicted nuclease of predicted toxin-antitoxin system
MRLLVDAQLPPALARWFVAKGHAAQHVADVGLRDSTDEQIWKFALAHSLILVTKDEDFPSRVWIDEASFGIIWVTIGNCSNRALIAVFEQELAAKRPRLPFTARAAANGSSGESKAASECAGGRAQTSWRLVRRTS